MISKDKMRQAWLCMRLLHIVVLLFLVLYPTGSRALAPVSQNALAIADDVELNPIYEVRRPQERNLRERIIADAVANAFADVIREKAGDTAPSGKTKAVKQSKVTPSTTPMNTKEFAYTNIRFKSFVNDDASEKNDDNFIQSLQDTAMQDAVQHQQQEEKGKPVEVSPDSTEDLELQLNAKLAAIQKEMSDLEDLKKALEASKSGDARRRLLSSIPNWQHKKGFKNKFSDTGAPGWDAFKLLNKKSEYFQDDVNILQKHISAKNSRLNDQLIDLLNFGTDKLANLATYQGDKQVMRSDNVRNILDAAKYTGLENIGRLQDAMLYAMERVEDKKDKLYDKIY